MAAFQVKIVTKIRVSKQKKKVSKAVSDRRKWAKFGDAKNESRNDNISVVSVEQVFLEKRTHPDADSLLEVLCNKIFRLESSMANNSSIYYDVQLHVQSSLHCAGNSTLLLTKCPLVHLYMGIYE